MGARPNPLDLQAPVDDNGDDAEAADARREQAQEDVGRRDKPKCEDVHRPVAVVGVVVLALIHHRPVDAVHPNAA